jgi:uncharacterized Ntn-hydrolase superfamily protein
MTFSIAGHCTRTGMFGVAITTSSICVGARCPHVRAGVGAVGTQNVTDPTLGPKVLDAIAAGATAEKAVAAISGAAPFSEYRQLLAVDADGVTGHFTGAKILGTNMVSPGGHCIAAGNLLSSTAVPKAMTDTFAANADQHLAERLLRSLEAGVAAGGEEGPVHSAALIVAYEQPFPLVDLRCDWDDENPITRLRSLWQAYRGEMQAYLDRALNPSAAPSYGVPGDE